MAKGIVLGLHTIKKYHLLKSIFKRAIKRRNITIRYAINLRLKGVVFCLEIKLIKSQPSKLTNYTLQVRSLKQCRFN